MKRVFVGLSGGVDSSVAALLLKQQGYEVIGVYMKNWSQDLPGMPCPWKDDFTDAKRVAVQLGIEFKVYDFEKQYRQKVVRYMLDGYKAGFTPNPDIVCNQEIKFKLFLETALEDGADMIATGHYARIFRGRSSENQKREARIKKQEVPHDSYFMPHDSVSLATAKDTNKDQTYFLYRVDAYALSKTIFPLGGLTKNKVRELARKAGLVTADKKESMGICFVGKVGIKDFLSQFVAEKPGNIIDQNGKVIGKHEGAVFYTIGQRHGLDVGGGLPYYVVGKSIKKNEIYVTTDLQDKKLWSNRLKLTSPHWIGREPKKIEKLIVRIRHQAKPIPVKLLRQSGSHGWEAELQDEVRALTPGQSAVFYAGSEVIGGGILI